MESLIKYFQELETRISALEAKIEELEQRLEAEPQEELEPEIEVELIVDDDEEATEELLTDEELQAEDELEDKLVEAIESPADTATVQEEQQETAPVQEEQKETAPVQEEQKEEEAEQHEEHKTGVTLPSIDDIRKAISLGDRFLFQRELFHGDGEKMNKTIDTLNNLHSLDDALAYIEKKFSWDKESQAYELFVNILKRRY